MRSIGAGPKEWLKPDPFEDLEPLRHLIADLTLLVCYK